MRLIHFWQRVSFHFCGYYKMSQNTSVLGPDRAYMTSKGGWSDFKVPSFGG